MHVVTIYESLVCNQLATADKQRLIRSAENWNLRNGVGSLLFDNENRYLQILEGSPHSVADAMKRISENPNHQNLKIRFMERTNEHFVQKIPFALLEYDDFEFERIVKNLGYKSIFQANVVDTLKIFKRTAGRLYRRSHSTNAGPQSDRRVNAGSLNLTEQMLGLRC